MLSAEEIAMFHAEIDEMARQSQAMALQYGLSAGLCTPEQMMNRENYMLKVRCCVKRRGGGGAKRE